MTDEAYVFVSDSKEKKRTASGAYHKRTHAGKGGRVMFPSDFLTKKELKAMNGEVVSYRMNDPMSWKEFRAMPEDVQVMYITALREKYGVPDRTLGKMFGVTSSTMSVAFKKLGCNLGTNKRTKKFEKFAWVSWLNGCSTDDNLIETVAEAEEPEVMEEIVEQVTCKGESVIETPCAIKSGSITFNGTVDGILEKVRTIVGHKNVDMTISWYVVEED